MTTSRFNFLSNGDIFDMGATALLRSTTARPDVYVGHIDSDGDIRLDGDYDQPELEAKILAELRAQFVARIHGNWPCLTDWPIALLRAIGSDAVFAEDGAAAVITRPGAQARARRSLRALQAILYAPAPLEPEVARVVRNAAADLRAIGEHLTAQAGGDRGGS